MKFFQFSLLHLLVLMFVLCLVAERWSHLTAGEVQFLWETIRCPDPAALFR